jgi:hypothetical protein
VATNASTFGVGIFGAAAYGVGAGPAAPDVTSRNVPPGWLRIWVAGDPEGTSGIEPLTCLLGATAPYPVRGAGGWGSKQRQGRRGRSNFDGSDTLAYSLSLILESDVVGEDDGFGSAAAKQRALMKLSGNASGGDDPPPIVKWNANAANDDYGNATQNRWVCESLEWGDSNSTDATELVWIEATLVLGLYNVQSLKVSKATGFRQGSLNAGQTLRQVAKASLGDPKRWQDIADLNRTNPKVPQSPDAKAKATVSISLPPRQ